MRNEQERNLHKKASGHCALSCMNAKGSVDRVVDIVGPKGMGPRIRILAV